MAKKKRVKVVSFDACISGIKAKYGETAIIDFTNKFNLNVEVISTGSFAVDKAVGIFGFPRGRIIEIYGPESSGKTTLALQHIAAVHKTDPNAICGFVDTEHALDLKYCKLLGIDLKRLTVSQPDCGEDALDIYQMMVESGAFTTVVLDSVAAIVPRAELEGESGDSVMGLHARLMSQALRKLVGVVKRSKTISIFINQLRSKIGVVFGCVDYDGRVVLADQNYRSEKIGILCNQQKEFKVKSFNFETGLVENKSILRHFNNGVVSGVGDDIFFNVVTESLHGSGKRTVPLTPNHIVYNDRHEEVSVSELCIGDSLLHRTSYKTSCVIEELIHGSLLGDGSIRNERNRKTASLSFGHSLKQEEYCRWKFNILKEICTCEDIDVNNHAAKFNTVPDSRFANLYDKHCIGKHARNRKCRSNIEKIFATSGIMALVVWYLDDGSFGGSVERWGKGRCIIACSRFTEEQKEAAASWIFGITGVKPAICKNGLKFNGVDCWKFHNAIKRYVPPSMEYKLHPKLRGKYDHNLYVHAPHEVETVVPVKILKIYKKPRKYVPPEESGRKIYKYDLEVEGNHNYFVDEILVHNSPEVTTGGNALKFYASMRLDVRKGKKIGETANEVKVKVAKNKLAPPFTIAETQINFGQGFDYNRELINVGLDLGVFSKRGNSICYSEQTLGKGMNAAVDFLNERPKFVEDMRKYILESIVNAEDDDEEENDDNSSILKDLEERLAKAKKPKNIKILKKKIKLLKEAAA